MNKVFASSKLKTLVAACAVSATAMSPLAAAPAAADGWGRAESGVSIRRGGDCFWRHGERYCPTGLPKHRYPKPQHPKPHDRVDNGDAAAAAIIGLAGAAILFGALSNANPPVRQHYVAPNAYPPAPPRSGPRVITYESTLQPWSPEWYRWCDTRYRSFNPQTGTFRGYDGLDHFCVPK